MLELHKLSNLRTGEAWMGLIASVVSAELPKRGNLTTEVSNQPIWINRDVKFG